MKKERKRNKQVISSVEEKLEQLSAVLQRKGPRACQWVKGLFNLTNVEWPSASSTQRPCTDHENVFDGALVIFRRSVSSVMLVVSFHKSKGRKKIWNPNRGDSQIYN